VSADAAAADPDGIVLADKPAGKTSHDLTTLVRRGLGVRRAGHAGTLDPFATGLMIVLVGRARRIQQFMTLLPKEYVAVARLGAVSTTGDPDGEITVTGRLPDGPLELPRGSIRQRPPAYSAVHVDGRRAYQRARAGEEVVVPEREVTIHEFEQLWRDGDRVGLRIACSSGTYVRSLVADLGDAYCESLRRTRIGPYSVDDADPGRVIALGDALGWFPSALLDDEAARRAGYGQAVAAPAVAPPLLETGWGVPAPEAVLLRDAGGPIALARHEPGGLLKPFVGFRA
jgi:tRNA pseudouridine55 synthase